VKITDYTNPFDAVQDFERAVALYTGAPYCISTDSCTHAIEIAFRLTHADDYVTFPSRTYLSVLMTLQKLNIPYHLTDEAWTSEYQFEGSRIWDSARRFERHMYRDGQVQCISFGRTKPLEIGRGGCILTDNRELHEAASRMRMDGRDIFKYAPWITQGEFDIGYHYYMKPEDCVTGLNLLHNRQFTEQRLEFYNYPDCRELTIRPYAKISI
jgi:dTDP-4-amino-4,6-dideoxygalactose transaminase